MRLTAKQWFQQYLPTGIWDQIERRGLYYPDMIQEEYDSLYKAIYSASRWARTLNGSWCWQDFTTGSRLVYGDHTDLPWYKETQEFYDKSRELDYLLPDSEKEFPSIRHVSSDLIYAFLAGFGLCGLIHAALSFI